jgi:hypothetical protein
MKNLKISNLIKLFEEKVKSPVCTVWSYIKNVRSRNLNISYSIVLSTLIVISGVEYINLILYILSTGFAIKQDKKNKKENLK